MIDNKWINTKKIVCKNVVKPVNLRDGEEKETWQEKYHEKSFTKLSTFPVLFINCNLASSLFLSDRFIGYSKL